MLAFELDWAFVLIFPDWCLDSIVFWLFERTILSMLASARKIESQKLFTFTNKYERDITSCQIISRIGTELTASARGNQYEFKYVSK